MSSTIIDGFTVRPLITITARDGGFCFDVNVADGQCTYTVALDARFRKCARIIHCAGTGRARCLYGGPFPPPTNNNRHLLPDIAGAVERHHRAGRVPGCVAPI